ncbi:integrin beta-1-like [Anneissia japonica]|uniref:integrin beta-1-like n=1 Tax=Anneissia japonica TaxID=1529436 RepID=UPI00142570F0|nr:integrin beta-1-like [Anneissia japonica]
MWQSVICVFFLWSLSLEVQCKERRCQEATSCEECFLINTKCHWCSQEGFLEPRCDLRESLKNAGCRAEDQQTPNTTIRKTRADSLRDATATDKVPVQLTPQEIFMKLRPGKKLTFNIDIRPSVDFPVDIYFLMDLSLSMRPYLDTMKKSMFELSRALQGVTRDLRMGFGSFVDKTTSPFYSPLSLKYCRFAVSGCVDPYGYKHSISLIDNIAKFVALLRQESISTSTDIPEGGGDALMQAIVCTEKIGWRPKSRHFIIYMSDAGLHIALDGKLGGITKPNDGMCHVNKEGFYESSLDVDFPSLGQLHEMMLQRNIIPVFAIARQTSEKHYQNLVKDFFQGAKVARLTDNSEELIRLVVGSYEEITSEIQLIIDKTEDPIQVKITSKCGSPKDSKCLNVGLGTTVSFQVKVSITECFNGTKELVIRPVGFEENVLFNIQSSCDCECSGRSIPNSLYCTDGNGSLSCGLCECNPGRFGDFCQCSATNDVASENPELCMTNNSTQICSGRGSCTCGQCQCNIRQDPNEIISGKFCECDNYSCMKTDIGKQMCNGRGKCTCGECQCADGFTGIHCECPTSNSQCIASTGEICNDVGTCECGKCTCDVDSIYYGDTCEDCDACQNECDRNIDCVLCEIFGLGPQSPTNCLNCPQVIIPVSEDFTDNVTRVCSLTDHEGCSVSFRLENNGTFQVIFAYTNRVCPEKNSANWVIAVGIILGILFIGLICLLCWKLATFIYDRKEYSKFQRELQGGKNASNENALYKPPITKIRNPTFEGTQLDSATN